MVNKIDARLRVLCLCIFFLVLEGRDVDDRAPLAPAHRPHRNSALPLAARRHHPYYYPPNNRVAAVATGYDRENSIYIDSGDEDGDDDDIVMLPGSSLTNGVAQAVPPPKPERSGNGYEIIDSDDEIEMLPGPPGPSSRPVAAPVPVPAPALAPPPAPQNGAHPILADADAPVAPEGMLVSAPIREVKLSPEQTFILARVRKGDSIFFTGSAGTGKSVLLREIIRACRSNPGPTPLVAVTASTGIAAVNVGGCTLHSWAGIGLGKEDKDSLVAKIIGVNPKAYKAEQAKRRELNEKLARGERLTGEEMEFLQSDPTATRKSPALERWRKVKTLIIDESECIL